MLSQYTMLFLPVFLVCLASGHRPNDYSTREGLAGHGGVFAALDWSDFELSLISSYHATADYNAVMKMVQKKLITSENISSNDRRRIERMLKTLRPPPVFNNFLNEDQIDRVHKAHSDNDVAKVLNVISERLRQLPEHDFNQAALYIQRHTPETTYQDEEV